MLKTLAATAAAVLLTTAGVVIPSQPAEAAVWGCDAKVGSRYSSGVLQYRGEALCWGNPPGTYYRIKAIFSVFGTGQGDLGPYYGAWVKPGTKSATKWVAWPYWPNDRGLMIQSK